MRYELMKWKIIADSGCDYRSLDNLAPDTEFVSVPLTIQVGDTIYTDDAQLNFNLLLATSGLLIKNGCGFSRLVL